MADNTKPVTSSFNEDTNFQERQQKAQAALRESEEKAAVQAKRNEEANQASKPNETPLPLSTAAQRKNIKKKTLLVSSSAGLAVILIMTLAIVTTVFLSPSLLLLNVKEKLTNDLNDALGYYYTTTEKVMAYQLSNGSGCAEHGDDSIHCKFSTMSESLRDRYQGYGFDVAESSKISLGLDELNDGRIKVNRIIFPGGGTANASNLYSVANRSELNRQRLDRVFNPSKGIFHSRGYIERLYERFHLQKSQLTSGTTDEEVIESFNQNLIRTSDYMDKDGRGVYGLHYLSQTEDAYWYDDVYGHILDKAQTHLSLGCSMQTYADIGENSLRQAKATTLARFAMQYLALSDTIKAGRTMQLEQVIGMLAGNLTQVSSSDGQASFTASDMSSYRSPTFHEEPDFDGPRMPNDRDYMIDYSNILKAVQGLGLDTSTFLRAIMLIPQHNASVNFGTSSIARDLCIHGTTRNQADHETSSPEMCWLQQSIPTAAAYGVGASAAVMAVYLPLKAATKPAEPPCMSVDQHVDLIKGGAIVSNEPVRGVGGSYVDRVRSSARSEARQYQLENINPTQTMDAIFAGTGVILGDTAQWLGMQPADRELLKEYLKSTENIRMLLTQQNIDEAKKDPLDVTSPYSFIGSILTNVYKSGEYNSFASLVGSALSVVPNAATSVLGKTVSATTGTDINYLDDRLLDRVTECGIENINNLEGVFHPDFGCGIRYAVNQNTMNLDIENVLDFMTTDDMADEKSKQNSQEIQNRDVSMMGSHGSRMKAEDQEASTLSFIDKKSGRPNPNTEYWKFLEYCSNRQTAWGSIGMAVADRSEEYEPDLRDQTNRRTYGPPYFIDEPTIPDNSHESYFGYAWGGSEDYKWFTGVKCTEDSEMLNNFRAYTAMCAVHAATSGARKCWHHDSIALSRDDFPASNGILYVSE